MGQPKTPGTMLQDGYTDTNVKTVLAAGTYPWTNLFIPHWSWQGLLSLDKPGGEAAGLRCYKCRNEWDVLSIGPWSYPVASLKGLTVTPDELPGLPIIGLQGRKARLDRRRDG